MKNAIRILCAALALLLMASCALAEAAPAGEALAEDAVLATVNGENITFAEARTALLYLNDSSEDDATLATAVDYLLRSKVMDGKIREFGLDQFTAEEEEAFLADAQKEWDDAVADYVNYFLAEDTEEARAQLKEQAEQYYTAAGYSVQLLADGLKNSAAYELLEKKMLEGKDISVTDEEVRALFDEVAEEDRQQVQDSPALYEYKTYYGYATWYVPEGFRGIIHILLKTDEALLTAYQAAQAAYEETVSEEAPEGDADLKAKRDEALAAVLESRRPQIDDIYARLEKGESFESLVAAYGEDSGMDEATLKEGYSVHRDSILWDPVFIAAAFSEKMKQPGDTSDPVVGSFGIHILHYLRDVPSGKVALTEEIDAMIRDYLISEKTNAVFTDTLNQWLDESSVTRDSEAIQAAAAQLAAEQETSAE